MAAPLFFVPLALAGGRVFFKFASKKAAQAFKSKFAKAGNVTTKQPPKSATVTTTGSKQGQSIVKDMTKPTTNPSIRTRNPNTKTLPKKPKSKSGTGAALTAGATAVGVGASATSTGKSADKPTKKTSTAPSRTPMKNVGGKGPSRTAADKIAAKDANMNIKKNVPSAKKQGAKTWKDYSSIAEAKRAGSTYYSKNGKKQAAVTKADLDKSGLSLRDYVNYKTGKTRKKDKK